MQGENFGKPPMMMGPQIPGDMMVKTIKTEATLYVGNLNPQIQTSRLFNYFRTYGEIVNCKIMRDIYSGESRGFAFISYQNIEDAKNAKEKLNYEKLDGFELRIYFKRNPSDFKPDANIYVKNIDKKVSTKKLEEACSEYGSVLSCTIRNDKQGNSLGYGYVQFEDKESASRALENLNGFVLGDDKIVVEKFVPQKNRKNTPKNLYLKNFPQSWDKETIEKFIDDNFKELGTITCKGVYENKQGEVAKFYAFVAYEEDDSGSKAIEKFNEKKLTENEEDEPLYVGFAMSKEQRKNKLAKEFLHHKNNTNLYIKSIVGTASEEHIKELFAKYGEITSIFIKDCPNGAPFTEDPLKFGFINFKNKDEASEAFFKGKKDPEIQALIHPNHNKSIDFLFYAQPKIVRMQYLRMKKKMMQIMMQPSPFMMMGNNMNMNMNMFNNNKQGGGFDSFTRPPFDNPQMMFPEKSSFPGFQINTPVYENSHPNSNPNELTNEPSYDITWLRSNKREFNDFSEEKQRNILGELMFNCVSKQGITDPAKISKITGMLIDLEILEFDEILDMLENEESLKERIKEALDVIEESEH